MYRCSNCGGNLVYDIPSHMLRCKYCNNHEDPYSVEKESDGVERQTFESTIFTCPQCGGEILSTDEEAAGFCSYCGASTILSSRISSEKRPKEIVPFEVTKEECKQVFASKMKKSIFAPKELKKPENIESFRGIYMPYWKYKIMQEGNISLEATKSHRSGDYIITDHFNANFNLGAGYDGFTYDASSSFYDNISENLAPFNVKDSQPFTPSMLSGFYADLADVPPEIYLNDANKCAIEDTMEGIKKFKPLQGLTVDTKENKDRMQQVFGNSCREVDATMLPVWFMSYRKKDRVLYSAINGQTGKMVTDIPIDNKKYVLFSILLAIPIFFMLNLFFTFKPDLLLKIISVLSLLVSVIFTFEINAIETKETNRNDKALNWKKNSNSMNNAYYDPNIKNTNATKFVFKSSNIFSIIIFLMVLGPFLMGPLVAFTGIVTLIGTTVVAAIGINKIIKSPCIKGIRGYVSAILAVLFSAGVDLIEPVMDEFYYIGAIVSIFAVLCTVISIIKNYNVLSSRRLPQFNKQGGDDRA